MDIWLTISPEVTGGSVVSSVLTNTRANLAARRILYPRAPGKKNHTRLSMAHLDKDHPTQLRTVRGYAAEEGPDALRAVMLFELEHEVRALRPDALVLSDDHLFSTLNSVSELERLKSTLSGLGSSIQIILHVDEPAKALARHYAQQVWQGRVTGLEQELDLATGGNWFADALAAHDQTRAKHSMVREIDLPPFWIDFASGLRLWEGVFGLNSVHLCDGSSPRAAVDAVAQKTGMLLDSSATPTVWPSTSDQWLARGRDINNVFRQLERNGVKVDRKAQTSAYSLAAVGGPELSAGMLSDVSVALQTGRPALIARAPELSAILEPAASLPRWQQPQFTNGFRATQYVGAGFADLQKRNSEAAFAAEVAKVVPSSDDEQPSDRGVAAQGFRLPPEVDVMATRLSASRYAPHNGLTKDRPNDLAEQPFPHVSTPPTAGRRILAVTCMKNEGPFILEWIAYHRALGIADFLIYTNDCDDGTDEILQALDRHGIITHRSNNNWKGQSPQKAALNKAIGEDAYLNADWIVHFDTDEFINIKIGQGRLDDLFAAVPGATAFSLTWRTFGHNDVVRFEDRPVIEQFTAASPTYIPKPHTAWGFKTLFRNDGVYAKLSCHRPTHPDPDKADQVVWVNGSGQVMPPSTKEKGWRSDVTNIGYDLVQLNHYPLRSAESFLVKRQRGRALHVDRSIGRNYWIRNDWNDFLDDSILRNVPRMKAEMQVLLDLDGIRDLHAAAVTRHIEKIRTLRETEEFENILAETTSIKITALQRVAYSLMLDIADRGN